MKGWLWGLGAAVVLAIAGSASGKAGHDFTDAAQSADFLRRVEAFLARHNPAGAAAAGAPAAGVSSPGASR